MREGEYQRKIIDKLEILFPGCIVLMNDPGYTQGVPDLTVFYNDQWAALEIKLSVKASRQPNQSYYIDRMNDMSFAAFLCPENEEEVLNALQSTFGSGRKARIS